MFELVEADTLKPHDYERIGKQRAAIFSLMSNGGRWTLSELERVTGYPQASISARLRDFRKPKFGGHIVRRERIADSGPRRPRSNRSASFAGEGAQRENQHRR